MAPKANENWTMRRGYSAPRGQKPPPPQPKPAQPQRHTAPPSRVTPPREQRDR